MDAPIRTALYPAHVRWNGNMVDFHGYYLQIFGTQRLSIHMLRDIGFIIRL